MSKYDLDRLHDETPSGRGAGRTVTAIFDAIGKLMVTENKIIYYLVPEQHWEDHVIREFIKIVTEHFELDHVKFRRSEIGIKGYSSKIVIRRNDTNAMRGIDEALVTTDY